MLTEIKKNRPDDQMTSCFLKLYTHTRVCEIYIQGCPPVYPSALKSRIKVWVGASLPAAPPVRIAKSRQFSMAQWTK